MKKYQQRGQNPPPGARKKRARNADTIPPKKKKTSARKPAPCQAALGYIFPELTEQYRNYDEIQNQQITHIPVAQPRLRGTKILNNTNAHIFTDRTHESTSPDDTGKGLKHTALLKNLSRKYVSQPKQHDNEGVRYTYSMLAKYSASKPTLQDQHGTKTQTPLQE